MPAPTGAKHLPCGGHALTVLLLRNTGVSDIGPLAGLTNLSELNLNGTRVTDIAPLAGLMRLEELDLSCTGVTDVAPLAGLTGLTICLDAHVAAPVAGFGPAIVQC